MRERDWGNERINKPGRIKTLNHGLVKERLDYDTWIKIRRCKSNREERT